MTQIAIKPVKTKTSKCSFCGTARKCAHSEVSSASICSLCLQNAEEMTGALPVGAVRCVGCKKLDKFIVRYPKAIISYQGDGLDVNGVFIYSPVSSEGGAWGLKDVKEHVKCGNCQADVPLYLLSRTEYIR